MCRLRSGAERSEIELFSRRFVKNDKSLSFVIVGSSPAFSTILFPRIIYCFWGYFFSISK